MRNIAVILPYAVSIRDFVHTGTLDQLLSMSDTELQIYTQNPDLAEFDSIRSDRVQIFGIAASRSSRLESVLRAAYPLMFYDIFYNLRPRIARAPAKRLLANMLVTLRKLVGTRRMLALYATLLLRAAGHRRGAHQIVGNPDLVIATRSTINSLDYDLIVEAAQRGFRQLTAASSWDNFTTKGFFPFPVVSTVVWNRKMAEELQTIFKVPREEIVIAGYPRRQLLINEAAISDPASYLERIGIQGYRRFILYSASYSELTREAGQPVPRECRLIRQVSERLSAVLPEDTCILVRLHPFSHAKDEAYLEGIHNLRVFVPGRQDRYVERVMSMDDEAHLSAQLRLSECIISMASTITIDALSIGRPVLNVAFEPEGASGDMIRRFYNYNHFRDLAALVALPMARSFDDVNDFVACCLRGEGYPEPDMEAFERLYVPADSEDYPLVVRRAVEAHL